MDRCPGRAARNVVRHMCSKSRCPLPLGADRHRRWLREAGLCGARVARTQPYLTAVRLLGVATAALPGHSPLFAPCLLLFERAPVPLGMPPGYGLLSIHRRVTAASVDPRHLPRRSPLPLPHSPSGSPCLPRSPPCPDTRAPLTPCPQRAGGRNVAPRCLLLCVTWNLGVRRAIEPTVGGRRSRGRAGCS